MDKKYTVDELREHIAEVTDQIKDIADEYEGREFTPEATENFAALKVERESTEKLIVELENRAAFLASLSDKPENTEREEKFSFQTRRASVVPDNPHKLEEYRVRAGNLEQLEQGYRDGAMRLIERMRPSHPNVSREESQNDISNLVDTIDKDSNLAKLVIATTDPQYKREWADYVQTGRKGATLERTALSLSTTAGGYAVPVELDTTLILTNAGVVNPVRNLARVRQTTVNTVEFINTTGITAGFNNEATEASDNSPVLAQPTVNIEKAFAFVPMSIEIAEDWKNIQADLAMCFADAKNQLEAQKFLTGLGHASHEPQGLIAAGGATSVVTSASTAIFAVADLYSLENALSPRYRANASIVGNRAAFQKVRQLDTAGGANLWVQLQNSNPATLIGYPAYEWSNYSSAVTTSASTIMTIGDFNYFAIVDRIGMNVEFIPHLFGGSNRYPTGQRGLYMYWRTSSQVLSPTLGANSAFQSLKLL